MYLQKSIEPKNFFKKIFFVGILSATDKKAGSGSVSGPIGQWYESADPDLDPDPY
jgi:hypothetical protein